MSSVEYSTANAKYRQIYAVHNRPIKDSVFDKSNFDSVDAIVLEAYHGKEWFEKLWQSEWKPYYDAVFQNIQRTGKPVYVTNVLTSSGGQFFEYPASLIPDIAGLWGLVHGIWKVWTQIKEKKEMSQKEMTRRQFLRFWGAQTAKIGGGAYLSSDLICGEYVMQTGENPEFLARLHSSRTHLVPTPKVELTNAISARKIEEFIVPELHRQLGRTPRIVLVYGAGHSGLKEDLQYPMLRNFYLRLYSMMGFPGIDTTHLDTVTNVSINSDGRYSLTQRKANLF